MKKQASAFNKSLIAAVALALSGTASALTITSTFIDNGDSFTNAAVGTGGAAASNVVGGGTLTNIFNTAIDWWETAILDTHNVDIEYGWQSLSGSTLASHNLGSEGGTPHRETSATIRFDNDGSSGTSWFMDASPLDSSEYITLTETTTDYGGGLLNDSRVYTGATGDAVGNFDLFSTALHEIGHALGLSSANDAFAAENGDLDIDVDFVTAYLGSVLPTVSGAHLDISSSLMYPFAGTSQRVMLSGADILANCEISEFSECNFDPSLGMASVPVSSTLALLLLAGLPLVRVANNAKQVK